MVSIFLKTKNLFEVSFYRQTIPVAQSLTHPLYLSLPLSLSLSHSLSLSSPLSYLSDPSLSLSPNLPSATLDSPSTDSNHLASLV